MNDFIEEVYQSLCGELVFPLSGVEDAFAKGAFCHERYREIWEAYGRLCDRLRVRDEDGDVEVMIHAFLAIQRVLCRKMYEYGAKFGDEKWKSFLKILG